MSVEADWVYTGDRKALTTRNINVAYNPATGAPCPVRGRAGGGQLREPPVSRLGQHRVEPVRTTRPNYHALQTSFTKRMANHWQASATYTLSRSWQFDQLPLNPGCQYPVTIQPGRGAVCDAPITLAPDVSENAWYVTGAQRQSRDVQRHLGSRQGLPGERPLHLRRQRLVDAHVGLRCAGAGQHGRPSAPERDADRAQQLQPAAAAPRGHAPPEAVLARRARSRSMASSRCSTCSTARTSSRSR